MRSFYRAFDALGQAMSAVGVLWFFATMYGGTTILPYALNRPLDAALLVFFGAFTMMMARLMMPVEVIAHAKSASAKRSKKSPDKRKAGILSFLKGSGNAAPAPETQTAAPNADAAAPQAVPARVLRPDVPDFHTGRLRLTPTVPQRRSLSWMGGLPSLPKETAWPQIDGAPARFVAQIACADIPEDLLGGMMPSTGWMVFFVDASGQTPCVLHSPALGNEREPSDEAYAAFKTATDVSELLGSLLGPAALIAPRWYLEKRSCAAEDNSLPDLEPSDMREDMFKDATLGDPFWEPFDWPSALLLLDALIAQVGVKVSELEPDPANPGTNICAERRMRALAQLRLHIRLLEQLAETEPFDTRAEQVLYDGLDAITDEGWYPEGSEDAGRRPVPLTRLANQSAYMRAFETYCRQLYTAGGAPPKAVLTRLMPVWEDDAERESLYLGNAVVTPGQTPAAWVDLLKVPTSALTGWNIGAQDHWSVRLAPEDLKDGFMDKAVAETGQSASSG